VADVAEIVGRDVGRFDRVTLGFTIVRRAQEALRPGEEPLRAAVGQLQGNRKFALLLLTNQRVLVVRGGLTMGFEDLPLDQITSVHTSLTKLVIATGGRHEVDIRAVANVDHVAAAIREAMEGHRVASYTAPAETATAQPDVYDQLRKLGELKNAGVLTEEEFAEKKAKLLAEM
jgi:hypothetical protein